MGPFPFMGKYTLADRATSKQFSNTKMVTSPLIGYLLRPLMGKYTLADRASIEQILNTMRGTLPLMQL